jgi:hypothetical protein
MAAWVSKSQQAQRDVSEAVLKVPLKCEDRPQLCTGWPAVFAWVVAAAAAAASAHVLLDSGALCRI